MQVGEHRREVVYRLVELSLKVKLFKRRGKLVNRVVKTTTGKVEDKQGWWKVVNRLIEGRGIYA